MMEGGSTHNVSPDVVKEMMRGVFVPDDGLQDDQRSENVNFGQPMNGQKLIAHNIYISQHKNY